MVGLLGMLIVPDTCIARGLVGLTDGHRPNDVFIAVMGVTGSGKSSLISICSGKVVKVGHHLGACKQAS